MSNFSKNLIVFRYAKMKSAQEVESETKIYPKRLHNIESREMKPTIEELQALSNYYGYSIDDMVNREYYLEVKEATKP